MQRDLTKFTEPVTWSFSMLDPALDGDTGWVALGRDNGGDA